VNSGTEPTLGSEQNPLRVAVVGSGPSGFYAAEALFKTSLCVRVDMFERLPVPFGLVRYGVAPDHPKLKQISLVFEKIAQTPGFAFHGNVALGRDLSLDQLGQTHHVIILAYGAESDRRLGIPNEDLPGSHTATEFVGWYNGHPEYRDAVFDLSGETAVIIGQGNVAIDVARILAKPIDELRKTDIASHALEALAASRLREIHVIGRRGPAQSSFTSKELREIGELTNCGIQLSSADLELGGACIAEVKDNTNTNAAGNVDLFRKWLSSDRHGLEKSIHFHFFRSPTALRGSTRVQRVLLERNRLEGESFSQRAVGTGEHLELPCDILFRSIGYRGLSQAGVPFDESLGVITHQAGRVGEHTGLYAVGWIKRGPSGIIGTNRADAVETAQTILADLKNIPAAPKPGAAGLLSALARARTQVTTYDDWLRIDGEERRLGAAQNKPREKLTRISEMLDVVRSASS
jgi:ferredoxin/flavodoxin---NADP+ reductase